MAEQARVRLTSWKEIATYLKREVRTVVRWEKERGLPVHRVPGGQGRSVFAFTDELDRWAAGTVAAPDLPARRRWTRPALAAGTLVLALAIAAGLVAWWPRPDIARLTINRDGLTAVSAEGRALWWFRFPYENAYFERRQTAIADLDGDGRADAVASADLLMHPDAQPVATLFGISSRGAELWRSSPADTVTFGAGGFGAPWQPVDVSVFRAGGATRIAWSVHHYIWWPSLLAVFDTAGRRLDTFVNAGWIRTVHPTPDGRALIAGAFSNSRDAAAFAVLDPAHPSGRSPEDDGSPYACRSCPAGTPLRYITVQWTDLAAALSPGERDVSVTFSGTGTTALHAMQRDHVEAIVELSASLDVVRASFSDSFWEWHRRLEADGTLTHARAACPFRDGPIVREWTPARGWQLIAGR
jgi:hypothetical protein